MSDVWNYIQKIKNNDNNVVSLNCQLCEAEYSKSTSTATLCRHLTSIHSSAYIPSNQPNQNSSYTFAEQVHITTKLAEWIIVDLQPFNTVEQIEFIQFVCTLDPQIIVTRHKVLSNCSTCKSNLIG